MRCPPNWRSRNGVSRLLFKRALLGQRVEVEKSEFAAGSFPPEGFTRACSLCQHEERLCGANTCIAVLVIQLSNQQRRRLDDC